MRFIHRVAGFSHTTRQGKGFEAPGRPRNGVSAPTNEDELAPKAHPSEWMPRNILEGLHFPAGLETFGIAFQNHPNIPVA